MLYNPKWNVYSLDSLIAWLEKQPADKKYRYSDMRNCVVAQYLKSHNVTDYMLSSRELGALGWQYIAMGDNTYNETETFGEALKRAKRQYNKIFHVHDDV